MSLGLGLKRGYDRIVEKRVLVVEDDKWVRETLRDALELMGFRVALAENGQQALQALQEEVPCLILLDLMMPVMSGQQFRAQQMADPRLAGIPVVVISADNNARQKAAALGASDSLLKPIDFQALADVANRYCRARPTK